MSWRKEEAEMGGRDHGMGCCTMALWKCSSTNRLKDRGRQTCFPCLHGDRARGGAYRQEMSALSLETLSQWAAAAELLHLGAYHWPGPSSSLYPISMPEQAPVFVLR